MPSSRPLAVAIQMDPIETIDIKGDSTFALALEAQKRGHSLRYYLPEALAFRDGTVTAKMRTLTVRDERGDYFTAGKSEKTDLADMDVVLMRQDPPFNMSYITATHLLDHVHPKTLVVNDPAHVRNAPEKLYITHFKNIMPPTLVTRDKEEIRAFRAEHGDIIIKPLFGNGGEGVVRLRPDDENMNALLDMFGRLYPEPLIVQTYLPEIRQGDKRIILVDGKPVGAINRIPPEGESRSNMHVGGRPEKSDLTERDRELCALIGPALRERGLIFVGIDIIGRYMTEINVTSPTGIREIERFDGTNVAGLIWDAIERRLRKPQEAPRPAG